jgi:diguanylate cyclase (GGDEF)-like protein
MHANMTIDAPDKTAASRGASLRRIARSVRATVAGRLPLLATFAGLLLLNWGMAVWLVQYTYQQREDAAYQLVNDEVKYADQKIAALFNDADRTLLALLASNPGGDLDQMLRRWPHAGSSGGIAVITPDGHVVASTPHASTAGWPRLMARLTDSADILAIGEPVLDKAGHLNFVPVARRISGPGGSFSGIVMMSLESQAFPDISPAVKMLDGCMSLVSDDDVILARTPDMRGTVGIRVARKSGSGSAHRPDAGMGRHISTIDGIDRIYSYRHLRDIPATLMVGIGYDATFAGWETLRIVVVLTRVTASSLILIAAWFWYTRRRQARISAVALSAILTNIDHGVRVEDADGKIIAVNDEGNALRMPDDTSWTVVAPRPDGAIIQTTRHDIPDGGTILIGTDVTARRAADARIDFLTDHDVLTGLPNRWRAASRIQELIAAKSGSGRMSALILLDLDGFQDVNDNLTHRGGDEVLTEVAERLRDLAGDRDVVARLGGDEFLLFLDDPDDEPAIMGLARQIPRALSRPINVRGQQVRLGASMGIALHPRDGADVTTLFQHANIALSRAKQAGRGTARSFNPDMMVSFEEHRMMESDLRRALDDDELELRMQPQFSCDTLDITGFEALARWRHPVRGELPPAAFIPIAERSGLIIPLGLWAIEHACKAAAGWSVRHRVAVNVSPLQLQCETIQEDIRGILRRTQFPAHLLELEVTESVLMDEDQRTLETLHKLRSMDIRITLDDFGTGYSSLSYIRRFPFDKIKIDKSFIQTQSSDRGTRVILEAMIRMCTDLGFDVVAEGIETEAQLNELRQLGCHEVQGFLLGEPLKPGLVEDFLASHDHRRASRRNQSVERAPN